MSKHSVTRHNAKHPSFVALESKISSMQGIPKANAGAILASAARKAGKKAVKANPRLKHVPR